VISRGSTNGRCVYEGPQEGRYYLTSGGNKQYLSNGARIKQACRRDGKFHTA
jgi:hypothetical protein